jgi:AcrR family transcriptional regulator
MKNKSKNHDDINTNAKECILKAAEEIFSEKGYDGARVDEIAKKSGYNKAMIYYYFESKQKMLKELVQQNINAIAGEKLSFLESSPKINENNYNTLVKQGLEIFEKRKDVFKITLIESLKEESHGISFFELIDPVFKDMFNMLNTNDKKLEEKIEIIMASYFFATAPMLFYFLMKEKCSDYYKLDEEKMNEVFFSIFNQTYGNFILKHINPDIEK